MAFSEKTKLIAKKSACFHCVICHRAFVEVHHIVPQSEGGSDDIENAVALCAGCHDLYGGNPEKRKQIREMRNHWYELMEKRKRGDLSVFETFETQSSETAMRSKPENKGIAIYHCVYENEDFATSAKIIIELLSKAQEECPDKRRHLYLDIEGHKNSAGGFDGDMYELQRYFILEFLGKHFTTVHLPLFSVSMKEPQDNNVPNALLIQESLL